MTADYKLNLEGDLDLSTSAYELVEDNQQLRQAVQIGLSTYRGEWFENINFGIPWLGTILSQRDTKSFMDSFIIAFVNSYDGIQTITEYESTTTPDQTAHINFTALATTGSEVEIGVAI